MEVVDSSNHITGHYRALHKPRKWYQRVFYHFLDIVVENAFIMQELMAEAKKKKPLTRKGFLEALLLELTEISPQDWAPVPSTPSSGSSSAVIPQQTEVQALQPENSSHVWDLCCDVLSAGEGPFQWLAWIRLVIYGLLKCNNVKGSFSVVHSWCIHSKDIRIFKLNVFC